MPVSANLSSNPSLFVHKGVAAQLKFCRDSVIVDVPVPLQEACHSKRLLLITLLIGSVFTVDHC